MPADDSPVAGGWRPASPRLLTRWGTALDPERPLPEYPRPQQVRPDWLNLNGLWQYAVTSRSEAAPSRFEGQILVPFAIESSLSGVGRSLGPKQHLWYQRSLRVPEAWRGRRVLLHFGAVDWEAEVWWGEVRLGSHRGGYLPFSFEVTEAIDWEADNRLRVKVWDPTSRGRQQRGKQSLKPRLVFYTAVSGIWQTVWLEPVPATYLRSLKLTPDVEGSALRIEAEVDGASGDAAALRVAATASRDGASVGHATAQIGEVLTVEVAGAELWTPDRPTLYDLTVRLEAETEASPASGSGTASDPRQAEPGPGDCVQSYFAMRSFDMLADARGRQRMCLNGEPIFQLGPLDQGYWPDGLYTAPSDEALRFDVEVCKRLGFNMIRKHVKVEPARWYHHCDQLGLIVWQDMPNGGALGLGFGVAMAANQLGLPIRDDRGLMRFGRGRASAREDLRRELQEMIEALASVPCIAVWVPFNEGWGQFSSRDIAEQVQRLDPTRLVDAASGWFDQGAGHLASLHKYVGPAMPAPEAERAAALTEFGGLGLEVGGHRWNPGKSFVYRMLKSPEALLHEYVRRLEFLVPLIAQGLCAAIYTQLTDVEIEVNGLLTYDRAVEKMDAGVLAALHRDLIAHGAGR